MKTTNNDCPYCGYPFTNTPDKIRDSLREERDEWKRKAEEWKRAAKIFQKLRDEALAEGDK